MKDRIKNFGLADDGELSKPVFQNLFALGDELEEVESTRQQQMLKFIELHENAREKLQNYCITVGKKNKCLIFRTPLISSNTPGICAEYLVVNQHGFFTIVIESGYIPDGNLKDMGLGPDIKESNKKTAVYGQFLVQEDRLVSFHNTLRKIARGEDVPLNFFFKNIEGENVPAFRFETRTNLSGSDSVVAHKLDLENETSKIDEVLLGIENYYLAKISEQENFIQVQANLEMDHPLFREISEQKPKGRRNFLRRLINK